MFAVNALTYVHLRPLDKRRYRSRCGSVGILGRMGCEFNKNETLFYLFVLAIKST
ncbi:hypothetical protein L579_1149 [Pantoea sp. AS-PWVM4]|nr:hypothetical protein L579_1149 [Pantoea sp. AS-PWVM4]